MNTTGQHPDMPHLDSVEADPAYDYAEDVPISEEDWDTEDEFLDAEEPVVQAPPVVIDAEDRVVPLDPDEVREPEQNGTE
jgi:hypothetical protein